MLGHEKVSTFQRLVQRMAATRPMAWAIGAVASSHRRPRVPGHARESDVLMLGVRPA
jgi:hypothetical protein